MRRSMHMEDLEEYLEH